ncbi:pimeloyl-ACP methyl ester carboxylesterase [Prauserella shujinwangii]|uniref:Pimeloyl-ACP methyl ester carboxylesterase n=1 Tax=Prauserella shujinwangii TaxID=1453103 RepID=A0A2T0LP33_9PSEU|nr:alpha/beta hydrolase [Prauserella shujinwangii]PRX44999.1 pimeloyl-ACP methyl ester carboxylesterase [Prauserella shujinwangii]
MNDWRDPRLGEPRAVRLPSGTVRFHERGEGPVLVFAHGYLVNANLWRKVVPRLAARFRCVTPDLPLGSHAVPVHRDADLSPPGIARLIADLLRELDLHDVTLVGNDSGSAYSQLVAAHHPERIGRLVLSSGETPEDTWPPTPGGFSLLKATAAHPLSYRALYQVLRWPRSWRWYNTYGWLAKYPIDAATMNSYVRPVLDRRDIRFDGRKAIGAVSARFVQDAARHLTRHRPVPVRMIWAAEDRVFPLDHAERYARDLGAKLDTIEDSYTYVTEDQPDAAAELITACATG